MRRTHRLRLACSLATAGAALGALAVAPAAQATPAGWVEVNHSHVSGEDSYLYDSWSSGAQVWNVGVRRAYIGGVFEWRNLVQQCSGSSCTATYPTDIEAPPNTSNFLQGVTGTSPSDVWAVGYARYPASQGGKTRPTIHHWNGTAWSIVPNPVTSGALYGISVAGPNDVWAVGAEGDFAPQAQLILHWNGSTWSKVPFAITGDCVPNDFLRDVAADGKRPMVIGECRVDGGLRQPMVASYRNGSWTREEVPIAMPDTTTISAVAWVGKQAWVGGGGRTNAVMARLKKHTWTDQSGVFAGTVYGIEGNTGKDLWAVGTGGTSIRLALHWNGHSWTSTDAGSGGGWLSAVTTTASGTPWAAGQDPIRSLIMRYDGGG